MKAGKITAKLRDAVLVCFMVDDTEVKRYKNIELPEELKELEIRDFHFDIPLDGKIAFQLIFDKGIPPEAFQTERPRITHEEKRAAKAAAQVNGVSAPEPPSLPAKRCKADKKVKDTVTSETPAKSLPAAPAEATDTKPAAPAKGRAKK